MLKDSAISLKNISKIYRLYDKPIDRLKESLHPRGKKYHKEFYALKNINLEVKKGEVLGIVGVNGAGKSTLLKIISGVLTPSSGRVNIHGRINAILELGSSLKPELTGRENIKLSLQINSIEKNRDKITQEIVEFADIGEHIDQPIKSYSSGMKARLGFGIATSTDPDILIVDEVLAVGDVLFQRKCYSKIEKLFKDGKTVIFVSHSAQSVIEFCSRAVLLYDREIIMDDTPKKVTDYYQKLVFSNDKQKVINEINFEEELNTENYIETTSNQTVVNQEFSINNKKNKVYYLSELLNIEPKYLNSEDVEFSDIKILNSHKEKVNILQTDKKYTIAYNVLFKKDYNQVLMGCQIRDKKGVILSGTNTDIYDNKKYSIKKNDIYNFSYELKCHLLRGDYFLLIYVTDLSTNFKAQVLDALWFKVHNNDRKYYGFTSLEQSISVLKIEK